MAVNAVVTIGYKAASALDLSMRTLIFPDTELLLALSEVR